MTATSHTPAAKGDKVSLEYIGTFDDGEVFDESHGNPLSFTIGAGQVIRGFNDAVIGMIPEEEKDIVLEPRDAYGDFNPQLLKRVPRANLPEHDYQEGMRLIMQTQDGQELPVMIAEADPETITLDLNHPMAGKRLHFHLKVVSVEKAS